MGNKVMLLTVQEVGKRLNVSKGLVYRLIGQGKLRAHRINSSLRVSEEQLAEYLVASSESEKTPLAKLGVATKFL